MGLKIAAKTLDLIRGKRDFFSSIKKKPVIISAVFSILFAVLIYSISYLDFQRMREKYVGKPGRPQNSRIQVDFKIPLEFKNFVKIIDFRLKETRSNKAVLSLYLNSRQLRKIELPPGKSKEYFIEWNPSISEKEINKLEIISTTDNWILEYLEIRNLFGYSAGKFSLIVLSKNTQNYQRIPVVLFLVLTLIFWGLGVLYFCFEKNHIKKPAKIFFLIWTLFLVSVAFMPRYSAYRLLFSPLSTFLLIWIGCSILFYRYYGFFRYLGTFCRFIIKWIVRLIKYDPVRNPIKFSFCILFVFLFYLSSMRAVLKYFNGNYSGFISIKEEYFHNFDFIFNQLSNELLFENSDFEEGTFKNWNASGDAFASLPSKGDNRKAGRNIGPSLYQGNYWLDTNKGLFRKEETVPEGIQRENRTGILESRPFIIKNNKISFLVGGGSENEKENIYVALAIDGKQVLITGGHNSEEMRPVIWDVRRRWIGKEAKIIIVDLNNRKHIAADYFHYYKETPVASSIMLNESGYDGQFFYFIAYDPFLLKFSKEPRKYSLYMDEPAYRYSRIGYPLLTKLFSLNNPKLFPKTMVFLILLSFLVGPFFLLKIIKLYGKSPWWVLLYIFIPGFQKSLHQALPESICAAFVLAGLYFYLIKKLPLSSIFFALSLLIRETPAVIIVIIIFYEFYKSKSLRHSILLTSSFIPLILWRLYLTARLFEIRGIKTLFYSGANFTWPFNGFITLYCQFRPGDHIPKIQEGNLFYPVLLTAILIIAILLILKKGDIFTWSFFMYSMMGIMLNYKQVWIHIDNGTRTTYEVYLFLILAFVSRKGKIAQYHKIFLVILFVATFYFDAFLMPLRDWFKAGLTFLF
jgi:hypothetical protein